MPGRFLLAGSSTLVDDATRPTGAGISTLRMRPLSLSETGVSTSQVSLRALFDGDFAPSLDPGVGVPALVDGLVTGGWPALVGAPVGEARRWVTDYLRTIVEVDLPRMGVRRDPGTLHRVLSSLGRGTGTDLSTQAIANEVAGTDRSVRRDTVAGYLDILDRLMVTEDLPAWAPPMRSATPLRKSPRRFMTDPSLALAAIGTSPEGLLRDLDATEVHFKAMVVRDLRTYAQPLGARLCHWRDNNQHTVDIVVTLDDGRWGAVDIRVNPAAVGAAAASLRRFRDKVDLAKTGEPAFLAVATTRSAAVRRADGVVVLPVASLGP